MTIVCAALMCHAPIVVPAIAGSNAEQCSTTTAAMTRVAREVVAHRPDRIVIVSPHAPRRPRSFGLCVAPTIRGDFLRFGHAQIRLTMPGAPEAAETIERLARRAGLDIATLDGRDLDHGTMVPLWFLAKAGYVGSVLVVALPYPGAANESRFGHALAEAASAMGERWAVVASGDMSHRLSADSPAGYEPRARAFDSDFVRRVRRGELLAALRPDPELRELAGEDVVQSTEVAAAAVGFEPRGLEVVGYEAPFGVGYLEAILYTDTAPAMTARERTSEGELITVARDAIRAALEGRTYVPPELSPPWSVPQAVFVTLRTSDGELRGCIGRTEPSLRTLAEEVADCAVSAAVRDPRFVPVTLDELDRLELEISILEHPEPAHGRDELDPRKYGVVVSCGRRRGVLLPDIEGVDTPEQQLAIAMRKGGIGPGEPHRIERFRVEKIREARAS